MNNENLQQCSILIFHTIINLVVQGTQIILSEIRFTKFWFFFKVNLLYFLCNFIVIDGNIYPALFALLHPVTRSSAPDQSRKIEVKYYKEILRYLWWIMQFYIRIRLMEFCPVRRYFSMSDISKRIFIQEKGNENDQEVHISVWANLRVVLKMYVSFFNLSIQRGFRYLVHIYREFTFMRYS